MPPRGPDGLEAYGLGVGDAAHAPGGTAVVGGCFEGSDFSQVPAGGAVPWLDPRGRKVFEAVQ